MTRRLLIALGLLTLVIASGVLGYVVIEGASLFDALYFTVITVGTVGYGETIPLSDAGRAFTMLLMFAGFGAFFFALATVIDFMVEGHLQGFLEGRRMASDIGHLRDHHIVAGTGRVGSVVANMLAEEGAPFVVIEKSPEGFQEARANGWLVVQGDATDEDSLRAVGIERARSLITALDTDADNLFVTFSARALNPGLFIVARSTHASSDAKLKRAGANRVMTPNVLAGRRMATMVLHPLVSDYLDLVTHGDAVEYRLQELEVTAACSFVGKDIRESHVRDLTGVYILAIHSKEGGLNTNPAPETVIDEGDRLVVLGTTVQLQELLRLM